MEPHHNNLFINPDYLVPQLSTKLYRTTHSYLKRFYSERIWDEICDELNIPSGYLLADDNWVSVEFGRRFTALVRRKTNDPEIYRKIGVFIFDPININPIEHQIIKTSSPFLFFKMLPRMYTTRMNRACDMQITKQGSGHYTVALKVYEGTVYGDMALNTLGFMGGLEDFYSLKSFSAQLDRPITPDEEISEFKVEIKFAASRYFLDIVMKISMLLILSAGLAYSVRIWESYAGLKIVPILTTVLLTALLFLYRTRNSLSVLRKNVEYYYDKSREKNVQLYEKSELLDRRYREASMLSELSSELITIKDPQKVMQVCLDSLEAKFWFKQIALFMVAKTRRKLFLSESRGLSRLTSGGDIEFDFPNPHAKGGFFSAILERGRSALVTDIPEYKKILQERNQKLLDDLNVGSLIVCPIQTPTEKYGLLTVFRTRDEDALTTTDKFLIEKICNFLALYFDNAANFDKEAGLRKIFQQYVPPVVLEEITRDGGDAVFNEPKRSEIVSVFIDLRDFTSMTEKIAPERVVKIISRYADFISEIFSSHGAVIDNIVGDAVVMFFPCSNTPKMELRKLFASLRELDARWIELSESMAQLGLKDFKLGIGAHIGHALVGNVGGSIKRNYTALGDTVNIAARLQSLCKKFPAQLGQGNLTVVLSKEILDRLEGLEDVELLTEKLRGRDDHTAFAIANSETLRKAS